MTKKAPALHSLGNTKMVRFRKDVVKVTVTTKHVERALVALSGKLGFFDQGTVGTEEALLAGRLLAHMEAFDRRVGHFPLMDLYEATIGEPLVDYIKRAYNLVEADNRQQSDGPVRHGN